MDFDGQKRRKERHISPTDAEALLYTEGKGQTAKLYFGGHLLMEHRNGLILDALLTQATGTAECDAALTLLDRRPVLHARATLAADKAYDTHAFPEALRQREVTPHVAKNNTKRNSAINGRATHHPGYARCLLVRKHIEECFGAG